MDLKRAGNGMEWSGKYSKFILKIAPMWTTLLVMLKTRLRSYFKFKVFVKKFEDLKEETDLFNKKIRKLLS